MHCGHECAIQTASNQIRKFTHVGHLASKEAYSVSLRVQFGGIQTGGGGFHNTICCQAAITFVQSIVRVGGRLVISAIPENITKLLPSVLL